MDWLSVSILHSTKRFRFSSPALLVWLLLFGWAHAEDQFPYVAYISQDDTYIRSGPGRQYYPTEQVPQGYAVEVYRHDQSGWCEYVLQSKVLAGYLPIKFDLSMTRLWR